MESCRNAAAGTHAAADGQSTVICGSARFTCLTPRLIRMEYAEDCAFEDRATLKVVNRRLPVPAFSVQPAGAGLDLHTDFLSRQYRPSGCGFSKGNLSITLKGSDTRWHPGLRDRKNLGGTIRTLDRCDGGWYIPGRRDRDKTPRRVKLGSGLLSRSGWTVVDDSDGIVIGDCNERPWVQRRAPGLRQDWYFFGYGHEYTAALHDAAQVFGHQPLPPFFTLGYWWCRYWSYTDQEFQDLVREFDRLQIPLDLLIIDMDWHRQGWTGFSWDHSYFPAPAEFLAWLQQRGVRAALNLHPAEGTGPHEDQYQTVAAALGRDTSKNEPVPFDVADPHNMDAYFDLLLRPLERQGVRFWWLDWQQGDQSSLPGLDPLPWLNQLHWEDHERTYSDRRPLCFSRYGGIGAGRYPVGFSGDAFSSWESLALQPHFTATAANVLYGYWSHDIGGHLPHEDFSPELYTRWLQYGVFSPILRTHVTKQGQVERRFSAYTMAHSELMRQAVLDRYELAPYIYSENRRCFDSGVALCRPMYYGWPKHEQSYHCPQQYMFGELLLTAPVTKPISKLDDCAEQELWLPPGMWFDCAKGELLEGGRIFQQRYFLEETPVFARAGAMLPGTWDSRRLNAGSRRNLLLTAFPGGSGEYCLYEDDGESQDYRSGAGVRIMIRQEAGMTQRRVVLEKAEGEYAGFSSHRNLELRLPGVPPPQRVWVQDQEIPWVLGRTDRGWSYDGEQCRAVIRVENISLQAPLEIHLEFSSPEDALLAQGLRGLLRRLNHAFDCARILEVQWERDVAALLQTGARITRAPETFADAVAQLHRNVRAVLSRREDIQAAVVSGQRYQKANRPSFEKTWRILAGAKELEKFA